MVCRASLFFFLVMQTISAQLDISFMRFYKNDKDFISDVRLLATARFYQSHLQVFYDLNKNPLIKEWVDSSGEVINREILQYDENKKLIRKYYTATDQQIDSVKYFGENEPWSIEFRKALKENSRNYFQNQQTLLPLLLYFLCLNMLHFHAWRITFFSISFCTNCTFFLKPYLCPKLAVPIHNLLLSFDITLGSY